MAFFRKHSDEEKVQELGATETLRPGTMFPTMDVFFAKRPERRTSPQVEFGIMWREGARKRPRYRVAWLETTGELVAEALSEFDHLRTIELLGTVMNRETLELAISGWESLSYQETTLEWVRTRISMRTPGGGVVDEAMSVSAVSTPRLQQVRRTA